MKRPSRFLLFVPLTFFVFLPTGPTQEKSPPKRNRIGKFRQLEEILPTPNAFRTASGAPGPAYWQQRADYVIDVELDDETQRIIGSETITYHNKSPDTLRYLWLQLDQNVFRPDSDAVLTQTAPGDLKRLTYFQLKKLLHRRTFGGGMNVTSVRDASGKMLKHTIVKTMMRIDLPKPLKKGESFKFAVDWNYRIHNAKLHGFRTGFEYFKEDDNYLYEIAQWFPRLVSYTDVNGWQHKQYIGHGEFTLELGDYLVRITVPDDHIVGATGVLQNPDAVLTAAQRMRLKQAESAKKPVFIVTQKEAIANSKSKPSGKKTWIYKAKNVRDFAFAASRRFIWDAQGHSVGGKTVMAMSLYPKEGEPLWSKYSTRSIVHTLNVYSRYTFNYPYPVAISVNGPIGGMEYPMICFNGPRPRKDGTYSNRTKYALISVIIHEVGHNYFPMIVNSDERQWTWMDEGLNTFLQYLAEQEWDKKYPSRRGPAKNIVPYMRSMNQVPIMTNSESILQFGNNAYAKPATALNILRETILGRELFDYSFKEYARRWRFKRSMPADFFRTMEDASGVDLDWFWRGWFYSTDHVDISIEKVQSFTAKDIKKPGKLGSFTATLLAGLTDREKKSLDADKNFYAVDFKNVGGLVMPILLQADFDDGSSQEFRIPAEIWRRDNVKVSKLLITDKKIKSLTLDPHLETADIELENNYFPRRIVPSRFQAFKMKKKKK